MASKSSSSQTMTILLLGLLILLAFAVFLFNEKSEVAVPQKSQEEMMIEEQGTSDNVSEIEKDINATNFDSVDSDFGTVESEVNTGY